MKAIYFEDWDAAFIPHILKEIYLDKVYDKWFVGRDNLTVVDLGANIGLWSIYASQYASKIFAVEPDSQHFKAYERNLKSKDFTLVNKAVANKAELRTFYRNPTNTTANTLLGGSKENGYKVEVITLDMLFDEYIDQPIDFMKMDIEGAEFEVLCGNKASKALKNTKVIAGEWHPWANRNSNQLRDALKIHGFRVDMYQNSGQAFMFSGEKV